jgi:hypothetical protein
MEIMARKLGLKEQGSAKIHQPREQKEKAETS